jgi:chloramphenicol-sensitive protein RarD
MSVVDVTPPQKTDPRELRLGLLYGLGTYVTWGLAPAYYHLLNEVTPVQILAHRVFWSVVVLLPLMAYRHLWADVGRALRSRRTLVRLLLSTAMISTNWFTFIYAVSIHEVVATALGYFINPLVVVLMGVFFLKERLRGWQIVSLLLGAAAVVILTVAQHRLPMISLILALSFASYGFLRKTVDASPLVGLFVETIVLVPVAVGLIVWHAAREPALSGRMHTLLPFSGLLTAVPLLWFSNAARRLRLSTMGLLQYATPMCSFLLAVVFFGEPFTRAQRVAFPMIWLALVIYSVDSFRAMLDASRRVLADEEPVLTDL